MDISDGHWFINGHDGYTERPTNIRITFLGDLKSTSNHFYFYSEKRGETQVVRGLKTGTCRIPKAPEVQFFGTDLDSSEGKRRISPSRVTCPDPRTTMHPTALTSSGKRPVVSSGRFPFSTGVRGVRRSDDRLHPPRPRGIFTRKTVEGGGGRWENRFPSYVFPRYTRKHLCKRDHVIEGPHLRPDRPRDHSRQGGEGTAG